MKFHYKLIPLTLLLTSLFTIYACSGSSSNKNTTPASLPEKYYAVETPVSSKLDMECLRNHLKSYKEVGLRIQRNRQSPSTFFVYSREALSNKDLNKIRNSLEDCQLVGD